MYALLNISWLLLLCSLYNEFWDHATFILTQGPSGVQPVGCWWD